MHPRWPWPLRLVAAASLFAPFLALGRIGGGEGYAQDDGPADDDSGGGVPVELFRMLVLLTVRYPQVMCPLLAVGGVAWYVYSRKRGPKAQTRRAFLQREAERRTQVGPEHVRGWVNALRLKDSAFELRPFLERSQELFVRMQEAWFRRSLEPVRPFLSDATFHRLEVHQELLRRQGVRDAIADVEVQEVQLIGLAQTEWYDSASVRIVARMRDTETRAEATDEQSLAQARSAPQEGFTEVWTFVRKPGVRTRSGAALFDGKCPSCGAPYRGGATGSCEYCKAVVNSGNHDWTLAEITQGLLHQRHHVMVDGLLEARASDPALNLEMLEDRTSLVFWTWVHAQATGDARRLSKLATPELRARLEEELGALSSQGRKKVILECAVGSVTTRLFRRRGGLDEAHVEVRWSARMGVGPASATPPPLPVVPQRWIFTLVRQEGATTRTENGMSTARCLSCNGPLTDSLSSRCDYCGAELSSGERDWVLQAAHSYEKWNALEAQRFEAAVAQRRLGAPLDEVPDVQERERLLYMMAAVAMADGHVDARQRRLLERCSERWSVPWSRVEQALAAGPQLFDRLVPRGSPEAEVLLSALVQMALVDGRVDRQERKLLESAAVQLGVPERLSALLAR